MTIGKLGPAALEEMVFARIGKRRREVVLGASFGEDSAALDLQGELCVVSTDPITGAVEQSGWLAVHVSCNDVAANGAEPIAVLLTILLPKGAPPDSVLRIMADAERAAKEVGVEIVGGHTEYTVAVNQAVVSATALGRTSTLAQCRLARPGDSLVVTKWVGLEGTAILAWDYEQLVAPALGETLLAQAKALSAQISIVTEARLATCHGVVAMHDITEGGVLGAAYELASAARVGFTIEESALPLHPATKRLVEEMGLDAWRLISSGSLLLAVSDPGPLVAALQQTGINATVIGRLTSDSAMIMKSKTGECQTIRPPESDELWRFLERFEGTH